MRKLILACSALCLATQMLLAQQSILLEPLKIAEEYSIEIRQSVNDFKIVRLDFTDLRNISSNTKGSLDFNLRIGDDYNWKISLEETIIKSPNHRIEENNKQLDSQTQTVTTYKGLLNGNSYNHVRLAISETMFEGYFTDESEMIFIRPLNKIIPNYPTKEHFIIFNANAIKDNPSIKDCGVAEIKKITQSQSNSLTTGRATTTCRVLEIATEADFEFFQANGSNVTTANNSILATLNQVEGVYQTTFNIRFLVVFQSVWSTSSDPFTIFGGTPVVDELANWWQANRANVSRDIVYFFSAKTGHTVKGSARVLGGAVCLSQANSYAFSATAVTNDLVITTAHEIGHLFSATHPDLSSAACSPTRTIMCIDPNPPVGRVLQFASFSQDEINNWINGNNACLTDVLNVNIGGTNPVCSSGQFTVVGLPPNSSVTSWSSANTSALTVTNGGVPTRQNNYAGFVNITANGNYGNDGCTFTSTKAVGVGNYLPIGTSSVNSNCSGNTFNVLNTSLSGACTANTSIYFTYRITDPNYSNFVFTPVSVPSGATWSFSGRNLYMTVNTPPSQGSRSATIRLNATGPCGPYSVNFTSTAVNYYSSPFSISPNPSNEIVTVSMDNDNLSDNSSQNLIYATTITDLYGTPGEFFEYKAGIKSANISVQDSSPGLYILSVFDGKMWRSERLIIQK